MEPEPAAEVKNRCAALREEAGLSAAQLARAVGVTRQTIYSIEAGRYLPNAVVALRLARALDSTVEDVFQLGETRNDRITPTERALLLSGETLRCGQTVQLGRVGRRLVAAPFSPSSWCLPPSDALVTKQSSRDRRTVVQLIRATDEIGRRVVLAGCDPAMSVLAHHARAAGVELLLVHRNSTNALELLRQNRIHIAGTHLCDPVSSQPNLPFVQRKFAKRAVAVVSFAWWEVGLVTAARNPKKIRAVSDLTRPDVLFVNREPGAGARAFLDEQLIAAGVPKTAIRGYDSTAAGHLAAAQTVMAGAVDCCIATRAAAQHFGLDFVALGLERYDFVLRQRELASPSIQILLDLVTQAKVRRELGMLGYEMTRCGERQL